MLEWILFAGSKKRIRTLLGSIKPLKTPLRSEHAFQNVRFAFCVVNVLRNDIRILTEVVPGFLPHHSMVTTFPRILLRGAAHVVWMYMEVAAIVTPQKQSSIYFRHLFDAKNRLYRRYDHDCKCAFLDNVRNQPWTQQGMSHHSWDTSQQ